MDAGDITRAKMGAAVFSGLRLTQIQQGIIAKPCVEKGLCSCICDASGSCGCGNSYSGVIVGGSKLGFSYEYLNNVRNGESACKCVKERSYTNTNQSPVICPDYTVVTPLAAHTCNMFF